ncbi:MAG: cell division protein FtsA [Candidatus Kapabacteria bacterium]|nr:cell division protein FtsA [Ignavibacteriota bacterium]MCW5885609.1 cell division protein FtsA [Candidatus Kapabacteria bacterium]
MSEFYSVNQRNTDIKPRITVGLDIGTSKICALVASVEPNNPNLRILGIGIAESEGLNRGVVVNIDRTTKAIKNVIAQAEQQSGIKISEVNIGIAGDHVESIQSRGIITISNPSTEISKQDVARLLEEARKINIPADREILHVIPQDFVVDGQDCIQDPVGMSGLRLEANVHIITGLKTAIQNISRCVDRAGLKIRNLVLEPLASSRAVLANDEMAVGVALVDIGGGTTDIAVITDSIIRYTSVFGIAGNQVTNDLQQGLGITLANAEKVKKENGHTYPDSIAHDELIMIPGLSGRRPHEISKKLLCQILQPRVAEIFELVKVELKASGFYNSLGAGGVVITGGSTLLRGIDHLAQEVLELPVKIGIPSGFTYEGLGPEIENPMFATAVGLALWKMEEAPVYTNEQKSETEVTKKEEVKARVEDRPRPVFGDEKEAKKSETKLEAKKNISNILKKITDKLKEL